MPVERLTAPRSVPDGTSAPTEAHGVVDGVVKLVAFLVLSAFFLCGVMIAFGVWLGTRIGG